MELFTCQAAYAVWDSIRIIQRRCSTTSTRVGISYCSASYGTILRLTRISDSRLVSRSPQSQVYVGLSRLQYAVSGSSIARCTGNTCMLAQHSSSCGSIAVMVSVASKALPIRWDVLTVTPLMAIM